MIFKKSLLLNVIQKGSLTEGLWKRTKPQEASLTTQMGVYQKRLKIIQLVSKKPT